MKENIIKCLVALLFAISIIGCTEKNNEETKITQRIMGAGDCIENNGWSWSNGRATAGGKECSLSFAAQIAGELSFSYSCWLSNTDESYLRISINNKQYFYDTGLEGKWKYSSIAQSSLGNVRAGEVIVFTGAYYDVYNIQIVGDAANQNDNNQDNPENPWDF